MRVKCHYASAGQSLDNHVLNLGKNDDSHMMIMIVQPDDNQKWNFIYLSCMCFAHRHK